MHKFSSQKHQISVIKSFLLCFIMRVYFNFKSKSTCYPLPSHHNTHNTPSPRPTPTPSLTNPSTYNPTNPSARESIPISIYPPQLSKQIYRNLPSWLANFQNNATIWPQSQLSDTNQASKKMYKSLHFKSKEIL